MAAKASTRKIVMLTAIISLVSFLYKLSLGIVNASAILILASVSTLLVFIAKVTFLKNATKYRAQKKKGYLVMAVVTLIYSLLFIFFSSLKAAGIELENQKTYEGLYGAIFIAFILLMFILSLVNLRKALDKTDLAIIGLKEITFVSALADLVIIEDFVSRIILQYNDVAIMSQINSYFVLGVSIVMLIVPLIMLVRFVRYRAQAFKRLFSPRQ